MAYPTYSNDCALLGWIEALITFEGKERHISHSPNSPTDEGWDIVAFDHDSQDMVTFDGDLIESYSVI